MPRHRIWFPPLSAPMEAGSPRHPSLFFHFARIRRHGLRAAQDLRFDLTAGKNCDTQEGMRILHVEPQSQTADQMLVR
jgi:hypothetical protein